MTTLASIRRFAVGVTCLAALAAPATPAFAAKPAPTRTATISAPYATAWSEKPTAVGVSADASNGELRASAFPQLGYGETVEDAAYVGSPTPFAWHTATLTIHVTSASAAFVNAPEFEADWVFGLGGFPVDGGGGPLFNCAGKPIFAANVAPSVTDQTVTMTCTNPTTTNEAVWGGVYVRTSVPGSVNFDATVTSIVLN